MADQQQLDLLQRGRDVWNTWRTQHPQVLVDLSGADLSGADLSGANFNGADLSFADLSFADLFEAYFEPILIELEPKESKKIQLYRANLSEANLRKAHLSGAILSGAILSGAILSGADLTETNFVHTDLSAANLSYADIGRSIFIKTNLIETDFSYAEMGLTIFGDVDLRTVKGLDTVDQPVPSIIGTDTISRSEGNIPEVFLRKAGVTDAFITYARALTQNPIEFYICFISYSSKDQEFAERLYTDLQSKGVRCWFAPKDMKTSDKIRYRIDESIRLYDKLLLVLSQHSIKSSWVEFEVETALARENSRTPTVLFPIQLDSSVMKSRKSWAAHIKHTRHITNFTNWKHHDDYQKAFARLLHDLQQDTRTKKGP